MGKGILVELREKKTNFNIDNDTLILVATHWANIYGKPSDFNPSTHYHDDRYLKLAGGTLTNSLTVWSGSPNTAKIKWNIDNAGSPQMEFSDADGDNFWAIGADDTSVPANSFKIHGSASSMPTLNGLATPFFEITTAGAILNSGNQLATQEWVNSQGFLVDSTDDNKFVNSIEFNSANGELTLGFNDASTLVEDLDGRWLLSDAKAADSEKLDGFDSLEVGYIGSSSDFASGILVTTTIDATAASGASWTIEVTGKGYGQTPFNFIAEGYNYNSTFINVAGYNYGASLSYIKVLKHSDGKLAFWWPRTGYWNSFSVKVTETTVAGFRKNYVTSIVNASEPTSDKKVQINLVRVIFEGDARLTDSRPASDVYSWAKSASKPSYTYSEIGAARSQGRVVSDFNHADFRVSGMYGMNGTPTNGYGEAYGALIVAANSDTGLQIAGGYNNDDLYFRGWWSSGAGYGTWRKLWHDGNTVTLKTALGTMPASDVYSWAKASTKPIYTAVEVGALSTNGKAADSDKLDGLDLHTGVNNEANKVVRTDNSGYAKFGWINTISGNTTNTVTDVYVNTNDGYIRKKTLALFKTELGSMPASDVYSWAKAPSQPAPIAHTHDDRYYTETESNANFLGKTAKATSATLADTVTVNGSASTSTYGVLWHSGNTIYECSSSKLIVQPSTGSLTSGGIIQGTQLKSTIATGTAPLTVASTTVVSNLSADMVDGKHASDFALASHTHSYLPLAGGTMTGALVAKTVSVSTEYTTRQARNIVMSTSTPSGGSSGDIWIQYS